MPSPKVSHIFTQALDVPVEKRDSFLREAAPDESTRRQVDELLIAHERAGKFLATNAMEPGRVLHLVAAPPCLSIGEVIGDFVIQREIGAGSFGTVYVAFDRSLAREVALKVTANVGEEGRTMASLDHDNIVKVFSETILDDRNLRLLCMPYVPCSSLARVLEAIEPSELDGKRLLKRIETSASGNATGDPIGLAERNEIETLTSTELLLWMGIKLADALTYAHQKGVLHLDIKPDNILLTTYGRPLLTDFNISQRSMGEATRNLKGGTLNFMPPEQEALFRGQEGTLDERADLYALGMVLRQFFDPKTDRLEIANILDKCTAADRQARYANASELADVLRRCREQNALESSMSAGFWARFPYAFLALAGQLPLLASIAVTLMVRWRLNPPPFFKGDLSEFWRFSYGLAPAAVVWAALVFLVRSMSLEKKRAVVLYLPLVCFSFHALAIWGSLGAVVRSQLTHPSLPTLVVIPHLRATLVTVMLTCSAAVLWTQLICGGFLYPRAWEGEPNSRARGFRFLRRATGWSLGVQIVLSLLPFAFGLAILFPVLSGIALPKPLALILIFGASLSVVGTLLSFVMWTYLSRPFK